MDRITSRRFRLLRSLIVFVWSAPLYSGQALTSELVTITDLAGRQVTVTRPVSRLILVDGTLAYTLPLLLPEDPFGKVVGWGENFRAADLDGYQSYLARFPKLAAIPTFPANTTDSLNAEKVIGLDPDLVLMNLSSLAAVQSSSLLAHLSKIGIPVVFVDFRTHIFSSVEKSIQTIGTLLDANERASQFLQFRKEQITRVLSRLSDVQYLPNVMIERSAGLYQDCCMSYGPGNFGELIRAAGGRNLGSAFIDGNFGMLHPEQLITSQPDVVLVTGANWSLYSPSGDWIRLGPGVDIEDAHQHLTRLMGRPAYRTLPAVRKKQVHAIWHAFYDNPYNFIALQQIAKWLHPEKFEDLDPETTFRELHQRFLPIPYRSGYWLSL
ncbi:ABC transporter substrate-binding protein [Photobacterium arenosum]|uniref:ABC transporter substrate-binding protein n=1 Tax=Photobacterium arenosum TaxID=2774143 RepID=UPI00288A76F6|nr:ABC transporter substrate-binding protein [Photobacterium arenosum]